MIDRMSGRRKPVSVVLFSLLLWSFGVDKVFCSQISAFTDTGQFNYASFLLKEGDYRSAAREFSRLIENFPASPFKEKAQFMLAESLRRSGRYRRALDNYRLFLSNFKESPLAHEAAERFNELKRLVKEGAPSVQVHSIPAPAAEPSTPLRAVQISYTEIRDFSELDREFSRLRRAGIDTVIFRVFHNRGDRFFGFSEPRAEAGVYYRTDHSPVVADILSTVTELAHRNGLRLFAWMTTRYADYGLEDREDLACRGFDLRSRRLVRCRGLDLFNEEVLRHLEALYRDLASYDIDGILFQDDLMLRQTEGFGSEAGRLFMRSTGRPLDPLEVLKTRADGTVEYTPAFWRWASWKNRRLLGVAERLRRVVREENPDVKFAINLMYETVTNPAKGLAWLSQDLREAVRSGFDYYSIMAYHRQMAGELGRTPDYIDALIKEMVKDATAVVGSPAKVLIKIQTVDWNTGEPVDDGEVVGLWKEIAALGDVSLAVMPYRQDLPLYELGLGSLASVGANVSMQ